MSINLHIQAVDGEDLRPRLAEFVQPGIQHDGQPGAPAGGHGDDVAGFEAFQ